jgi:hypothetical protein
MRFAVRGIEPILNVGLRNRPANGARDDMNFHAHDFGRLNFIVVKSKNGVSGLEFSDDVHDTGSSKSSVA